MAALSRTVIVAFANVMSDLFRPNTWPGLLRVAPAGGFAVSFCRALLFGKMLHHNFH